MKTILIIDDTAWAAQMHQYLEPLGFDVQEHLEVAGAEARVQSIAPDLILLDLHFPGDPEAATRTTGGALHTRLRARFPQIPVLIFSTRPENAAIPLEAFEVPPLGSIEKPDLREPGWANAYAQRLNRAINEHRRTSQEYSTALGFVVGQGEAMREFARRLTIAARARQPILLRGEPGVGKTLAAKALHDVSESPGKFVVAPLVTALQVSSIVEGATGLPGACGEWFAEAAEGTLFLPEIGDLSAEAQAALFEILETDSASDVRLVSATRYEASDAHFGGGFRKDLLVRLCEVELRLPPLRERLEDIPILFAQAVGAHNRTEDFKVSETLRPETLEKLRSHDWPGNIRGFNNILQEALKFTRHRVLMPDDLNLPPGSGGPVATGAVKAPPEPKPVETALAELTTHFFALLEDEAPGQARYDLYKTLKNPVLQSVTSRIFEVMRKKLNRETLKQDELSNYLFGETHGPDNWVKVRGYVSQNDGWPPKR